MFTTDAAVHAPSTRSKRNRQAAGNDDSVKLPLTKKRRSALRRDTFEPLTDASVNEIAGRERSLEKLNGHAQATSNSHNTLQQKELTLRGVKRLDKRSEKDGGQLMLSNNDYYSVAQLPSLPEQIRGHPSMPLSYAISPECGYVLALTHTDALIWPYNSSASVPSPRDLVSFKLPFPPACVGDSLPIATFATKAANAEPGIVAVSSKWGKVVYWETITSASSSLPGQVSSGVQGTIPGMVAGETIKELIKAEPAGFILTTSHGNVAHLTVRDQMGRPGIGVQLLRKSAAASTKGSIFGSIRNAIVGDRRRGTPIVRAGRSLKAQRDIIVGTEDGDLEFWSLNLTVGNSLNRTVAIKPGIVAALQALVPGTQPYQVKLYDLEMSATPPQSHELSRWGDNVIPLTLLVGLVESNRTNFYLVESLISEDAVHAKEIHHIKFHAGRDSSSWRPRLCLSKIHPVAFVFFERAIVLMSLAKIKESPSSQLFMEKAVLPEKFQESIRFQDDSIFTLLGYALEDDAQTSCVFAVQGFGIVRIASKLKADRELEVEEVEADTGAKSKIEQAIFFGTNRHNPLSLNRPIDSECSSNDIESAIIDISDEILSSTSHYLPKSTPSTSEQMRYRAKALEDLIAYSLKHYPSAVSRRTRFHLLLNAEKLAAAQSLWKVQETIHQGYPKNDDREMTYLDFTLRALHESRQKYPDAEKGEQDRVRHWLIHSVPNIGFLTTELSSCLGELKDMDVTDPQIICDYLTEAIDLWIAVYRTAFKFREDHAARYGLEDEVFEKGVLQNGRSQDSSNPWTSTPEPLRFSEIFVYRICEFLQEWWDSPTEINGKSKSKKARENGTSLDGQNHDAPSKQAMVDLAARLPVQVDLFTCMVNESSIQTQLEIERIIEDPGQQQRRIADLKIATKAQLIKVISMISHYNPPGAIELAERLKDPGLLVSLNTDYLELLGKEALVHPENRSLIERKIERIQQHVETYFDDIGNPWAFAHFSDMVENGSLGSILAEAQAENGQKQQYLSWFLGKAEKLGQSLGRISWINDVVGESRFDRAQKTLEKVSTAEENDIWAKKTELCLAKLAGLAAQEGAAQTNTISQDIGKYDTSLSLLDIQESLVTHISSSIMDAIDEKAARDLAVDVYASRVVEKKPALKRLLSALLDSVLTNQSQSPTSLVNTLTLMDPTEFGGPPDEDPNISGNEFAMALRVIDLSRSILPRSELSDAELDALSMTVWRRSMIRDDWSLLNNTAGKSDADVQEDMEMSSVFKALLEVYRRHYEVHAESEKVSTAPRTFSPKQIIETKTTLTPVMKERYLTIVGLDGASSEGKKFISELTKELNSEQEKLKKFVDKAQLQQHWDGMIKSAEDIIKQWTGRD